MSLYIKTLFNITELKSYPYYLLNFQIICKNLSLKWSDLSRTEEIFSFLQFPRSPQPTWAEEVAVDQS